MEEKRMKLKYKRTITAAVSMAMALSLVPSLGAYADDISLTENSSVAGEMGEGESRELSDGSLAENEDPQDAEELIYLAPAELKKGVFTYNGAQRTVSLCDSECLITRGTVSAKSVGIYKLKVTPAEGCVWDDGSTRTQTLSWRINPKETKISSLKAGSKSITVKYAKASAPKQITGYQIRYSKKASMNSATTVTVKSSSVTSKKLTGLINGKKYYVQVRTYKNVDGKKLVSEWSSKKSATPKAPKRTSSSSGNSSNHHQSCGAYGTVYYTPSGSCYHSTRNCVTLKRSSTIYSSTLSGCGGRRACRVCC